MSCIPTQQPCFFCFFFIKVSYIGLPFKYNQPYLSPGLHPWIQLTENEKYLKKKDFQKIPKAKLEFATL